MKTTIATVCGIELELTVELGEARYGTAEPRINIRCRSRSHSRLVSAAIYTIAAAIEIETHRAGNGKHDWCVNTGDDSRIVIELVGGGPLGKESGAAMAVLEAVVAGLAGAK